MDVIYESAAKFVVLEEYKYRFVVSSKRKSRELILDFCDSDFWHLAGLHYLTDISIPKNRRDTLKNIIRKRKLQMHCWIKVVFIKMPSQIKISDPE